MTAQRPQRLAQSASITSAKAQLSPFLRFGKIKSEAAILAAAKHNLRALPFTPNIDPKRSCLNEVLIGPSTAQEVKQQYKAMLGEAGIQKLRKDAVLLIETIVSLPAGVDDQNRQYFKAALVWLEEHFSQGNLLSATLHNDEGAQHMHVLIVPLVNGAMNGSDLLGGPQRIRTLQSNFRQAMQPELHALGIQAAVFALCLSKAEKAQAVLAHLKNTRDPALRSVAWQPIRDCIERHANLFYEHLNCPPMPPSRGTGRAIRPRKRMPTSTEIFTRRVGKLRGSQVEKYRDSEEYKQAHSVYVKHRQVAVKESTAQKKRVLRAKSEVAFFLAAPPFRLRTLCSVGFAYQHKRAMSSPLSMVVNTSLQISHLPRVHALPTSRRCCNNARVFGMVHPMCVYEQPSFSVVPVATTLLWRWPACWPRAPTPTELPIMYVITGEHQP